MKGDTMPSKTTKKNTTAAPLIAPQKAETKATLNVSIAESVITDLDAYCDFLQSQKSYVVEQMIKRVLDTDKAFAEHKNKPPVTSAVAAR